MNNEYLHKLINNHKQEFKRDILQRKFEPRNTLTVRKMAEYIFFFNLK